MDNWERPVIDPRRLLQVRAELRHCRGTRSPIDDERSRRGVARGSQHPKTDLASASRRDLCATYDALSWATELLDDCKIEGITHESGVEEGKNLAKNKALKEGGMGQLYPPDNVRRSAFFVFPSFFSSDVNPS